MAANVTTFAVFHRHARARYLRECLRSNACRETIAIRHHTCVKIGAFRAIQNHKPPQLEGKIIPLAKVVEVAEKRLIDARKKPDSGDGKIRYRATVFLRLRNALDNQQKPALIEDRRDRA